MADLQELKQEATDLGVSFPKNITAEKLQVKINEFYDAKETSGPALQAKLEVEEAEQKDTEKPKSAGKGISETERKSLKRKARESAAKSKRIITIVDNDQRVNTHTTTCTVNCSNEYFDLGTRILPLNEKIEVCLGHIKVLEKVKIPLHVKDTKTGLASVRLRPRYTISYIT